ncbi:MAG: RnfABCDGE type electron transport complex subunit G [Syntrophobacteria bacterium]|nr:RnfABCDGE type electron transport complex subunit G [Deltaproteobacteria bacterium]MDH3964991.1 RnfABCDGE type electron transport complex subunit G [Deltaproteobacteria bacterium]PNV87629.1 MAG: electron transporter RnfG [Desulfobacteraceae bacterium]
MRDLIKMVVVLLVICTTSGVVLSYVNEATKAPREYQYIKFVQEPSIKAVLSDYDNDPVKERIKLAVGEDEEGNPIEIVVFPAKKGGATQAIAYSAAAKGYHDLIEVMVGVGPEGKLTGISIMTHTETPGLGARIVEPEFTDQFAGLDLDTTKLSAEGGKVDTLSGATFSTVGVITAVGAALEQFPQIKKETF